MKETYLLSNLIIGKIYVCENLGGNRGPISTLTNEVYIFEIRNEDIVEEVITGDSFRSYKKNRYEISNREQDVYNHIFNKKYVVDIEKLSDKLTPELLDSLTLDEQAKNLLATGVVDKWTLVKIYNQLNFELQKNKQKQLKK